jgi:hypothetical protein
MGIGYVQGVPDLLQTAPSGLSGRGCIQRAYGSWTCWHRNAAGRMAAGVPPRLAHALPADSRERRAGRTPAPSPSVVVPARCALARVFPNVPQPTHELRTGSRRLLLLGNIVLQAKATPRLRTAGRVDGWNLELYRSLGNAAICGGRRVAVTAGSEADKSGSSWCQSAACSATGYSLGQAGW